MLNGSDRAARDGCTPARMAGPLSHALGHSWPACERGRVEPPDFILVVQGIIEFLFIFKPFQYLLPKYDSNSNSNFE
jgi:hypothetical protein